LRTILQAQETTQGLARAFGPHKRDIELFGAGNVFGPRSRDCLILREHDRTGRGKRDESHDADFDPTRGSGITEPDHAANFPFSL
jgi:hypothetical protein